MDSPLSGQKDAKISLDPFRALVRSEGTRLYRDLPWRQTRDPYEIWISEVMLQQTQVARVQTRWQSWLDRFPSVFALAEAPAADVLSQWQGMGYNRRALALKAAAERIVGEFEGRFPHDAAALRALPGIGPATAQGIRSFAFDMPGVYLETNVRTVFLHHFFPDVPGVPDRELVGFVESTCPSEGEGPFARPQDADDTPRSWYYALLDYGAYLKKTVPNPSRRSSGYSRQSRFEGSRRQKRAHIVRILLAGRGAPLGSDRILDAVNRMEVSSGRPPVEADLVEGILADLSREGFCVEITGDGWMIP
ncbi:MAG: adenine glycosylase [Collinsella sp.]|nr:adenine glycosylase [Collinsella sp.]